MVARNRQEIGAVKSDIAAVTGAIRVELAASRIKHGTIGRDARSVERPQRETALVNPEYIELIISITD